jgi:ornithine carbamoyltransferase
MRHFLDLLDIDSEELHELFKKTAELKSARKKGRRTPLLLGRVLGLVFEKPSLRTRVSFETAMAQLGGASVFLSGKEAGMGSRESVPDFARVMSQYVDGVVLRTYSHSTVEIFAAYSACPVINGLSDYNHPCQALADLFTVQEFFGDVKRTLVFVGDGNNVARSLAICAGKLGVKFVLAAPEGYGFDAEFIRIYAERIPRGDMIQERDPRKAVRQADVIYTDVWTSMGQEAEYNERIRHFTDYQVNEALLKAAPAHARVMHCLPAHRGEEITNDVLDGPQSIVIEQAGNRLHAQKALLDWLLNARYETRNRGRKNSRDKSKKTRRSARR